MADEAKVSSNETESPEKLIPNFGPDAPKYMDTDEYNVLHRYRSYNYVWTLAVLSRTEYNEPNRFSKTSYDLEYVILKSSGKGVRDMAADASWNEIIASEEGDIKDTSKTDEVNQVLKEFNSTGYGRFDFHIENVEMRSNWSITNGSQPTTLRFDVVEPWSINGFIEAMRVNALAAGYDSPINVPYVLKLEFIGYKDKAGLTPPEVINGATRYFPININQINLETTERGTIYKCAGNAYNSMGLGSDGHIPVTTKMKGSTVYEVLKDLVEQQEINKKKDSGEEETKFYNEYKLEFYDEEGNLDDNQNNLIAKAKINEELRSNQVFNFPELSDKNNKNAIRTTEAPTKAKYDPLKETITFAASSAITDIITAVIRDSEYTKDLLGSFEEIKARNNGMIPWFRVSLVSEIKPGQNEKSGTLAYVYTYRVRPYHIHYSLLPGGGVDIFDATDIKGSIRRTYDYYYTGQNIDIINFNLKFNNLFVQQRPYKMGNKQGSNTSRAMAASNSTNEKEAENPAEGSNPDDNSTPRKVDSSLVSQPAGGTGKAPQATPYQQLGVAIHETLMNPNNLNIIDLQIVGDPFYLVTAEFGNQDEVIDKEKPGVTTDGRAPYIGGSVFMNLNFRNPKDIKPNGWADFGEGLLPFSGIYQINTVEHSFRDGKFEQRFRAVRLPGQKVTAESVREGKGLITSPNELEASKLDSAAASVVKNGSRASNASLMNMLSRGLPTTGLPGILSNFSNAVGGALGGAGTALQTTLQRVDTAISDTLSPINGALQQAGAAINTLAQVGGLIAAGNALIHGFDAGGAPGLGKTATGYNPYTSGIRLDTNGLSDIASGSSQAEQASVVAQSNIVSTFVQDPNNLNSLNTNYFNNVISDRIALTGDKVGDAKNKADQVTNNLPIDPKALAYKLGINPAELSGMSAGQQSNILSQLQALAAKVPENTDIAGLKLLGLSMANIGGASIPNLPALQPLTLAPLANIPAIDLQKIIASGGNVANLPGALSIPSVAALLALLNKNNSVPNNGLAGGQGQLNAQSIADKLDTAQSMNVALTENSNFSNAQLGLGSVESNLGNTSVRVQGYGGYYTISKTAYAQYGTQRQPSPIDKLMQSKGV